MDKVWNAIYVNSRAEKKITESLLAKNIEAYSPIVKTMRQWSDRKKIVEMPLMNGYVFVKIDASESDKVMQTKGVVSFVKSEGRIAVIREPEINRLKQLVDLGYQLESEAISRTYKEGEKVKITSGPLKGIEGYVVVPIAAGSKENRHIEVLLESIGQCIRVKLPKEILKGILEGSK